MENAEVEEEGEEEGEDPVPAKYDEETTIYCAIDVGQTLSGVPQKLKSFYNMLKHLQKFLQNNLQHRKFQMMVWVRTYTNHMMLIIQRKGFRH